MEHLLGGGLVDFAVCIENLHTPLLARQPGDNARLDGAKVSHNKPAALPGNERGADKLRQCARNVVEEELQGLKVSRGHKLPRGIEVTVRHFILREVLHLHQAAGPASRARGAVELSQSTNTAVRARGPQHCTVFLSRNLRKARTNVEHLVYLCAACVRAHAGDTLFVETLDLNSGRVLNPALELRSALRILKPRQRLCLLQQTAFDNAVNLNRLFRKRQINAYAAVVNMLVVDP